MTMVQCTVCGTHVDEREVVKTDEGPMCRDQAGCIHDLAIRRDGGKPGPRGLQKLLRF